MKTFYKRNHLSSIYICRLHFKDIVMFELVMQANVCLRNDSILTTTKYFNPIRTEKNKFCTTDTLWIKNQL